MDVYFVNDLYKILFSDLQSQGKFKKFTPSLKSNEAPVIFIDITPTNIESFPNAKIIISNTTNSSHIINEKNLPIINLNGLDLSDVWSTAEHTMFLILSALKCGFINKHVDCNMRRPKAPGKLLRNKTVCIIGTGRIGNQVLKLLEPFNVNTILIDKHSSQLSIRDALSKSDIITIHISVNNKTKPILNKENFKYIKNGSYVINTSRGESIDEDALIENIARLGGAYLDVVSDHDSTFRFIKLIEMSDKIKITPHVAGYTIEDLKYTMELVFNRLQVFVQNGVINDYPSEWKNFG